MTREHGNCATCICGRRAPVQADGTASLPATHPGRAPDARGPGTIAWAEHELAWSGYAARYGTGQSAARMAERGGFSYRELVTFLGRPPETWVPSSAEQRQ